MTAPKCLITGCYFVHPQDEVAVWGDLHELGDCYIFSAVVASMAAAWQSIYDIDKAQKQVVVHYGSRFFDRRGVLVIAKSDATLNQAAQEYLK